MESWEALDVDDSDLPSLLRPCKRQHHQSPIKITTNSSSQSLLQQSQSQSQSHPQTPHSQSPHSLPSPPSAASPRLIPGPARAVQVAMHRIKCNNQMLCRGDGNKDLVPTQEYLRRVVEHGDEDDDFTRNPWLCALDFVRRQGMGDGMMLGMPLSSIRNCRDSERVPQTVAIIKSCSPNGLGDMMANLKDPTGTVGASIHRKVLAEGEFGRDIAVGAVLILQKVAVFSPSHSAHYLNITLSNVVKVISKDSGPPSKQNYSASALKHDATSECGGRPEMRQKAFSQVQGRRTDSLLNEVRGTSNARVGAQNDMQMEKSNAAPGMSCYGNGDGRNQSVAVEKEPLLVRQDVINGIAKVAVRKDTYDNNLGAVADNLPIPRKQANGWTPSSTIYCSSTATNLVEIPTDQGRDIEIIKGVKEQKQPFVLRASLPEWTDEQLDELFATNCENGGSLF